MGPTWTCQSEDESYLHGMCLTNTNLARSGESVYSMLLREDNVKKDRDAGFSRADEKSTMIWYRSSILEREDYLYSM